MFTLKNPLNNMATEHTKAKRLPILHGYSRYMHARISRKHNILSTLQRELS